MILRGMGIGEYGEWCTCEKGVSKLKIMGSGLFVVVTIMINNFYSQRGCDVFDGYVV